MGLDMYVRAIPRKPPTEVDFNDFLEQFYGDDDGNNREVQEIAYWRKHPNLHGWMEALYRRKGGTATDFNVTPVHLTLDDLGKLEAAIRRRKLPPTSGFFFGTSDDGEEAIRQDIQAVNDARAAIADGKFVYYTSWW